MYKECTFWWRKFVVCFFIFSIVSTSVWNNKDVRAKVHALKYLNIAHDKTRKKKQQENLWRIESWCSYHMLPMRWRWRCDANFYTLLSHHPLLYRCREGIPQWVAVLLLLRCFSHRWSLSSLSRLFARERRARMQHRPKTLSRAFFRCKSSRCWAQSELHRAWTMPTRWFKKALSSRLLFQAATAAKWYIRVNFARFRFIIVRSSHMKVQFGGVKKFSVSVFFLSYICGSGLVVN